MRAGSALLLHQRTIHSSLDNVTTDQVRISLDLRYQPIGQPTGRPAFPGFVAAAPSPARHRVARPSGLGSALARHRARGWLSTRTQRSIAGRPGWASAPEPTSSTPLSIRQV